MIMRLRLAPVHDRLSYLLPVVVVLLALGVTTALPEAHHRVFALAALFDATVTAAVLVWVWTPQRARRAQVLLDLFVRGAVLATLAFPELLRTGWLPAAVLAVLLWQVLRGLHAELPAAYADLDDLERRCAWFDRLSRWNVPGRAVLYEQLVLSHLVRRPELPDGLHFCTRAGSATGGMIAALVFMTAVEALPVHLLVEHMHPSLAWPVTGLSVLTVLWLVTHGRALSVRPVTVGERRLYLRTGLRWTGSTPLSNVLDAERYDAHRDASTLSIAVGNAPNVTISFTAPVRLLGLYATERQVSRVALHVDDPAAFIEAVRTARR